MLIKPMLLKEATMKSKFVSVVVCFAFLAMLAVPAALSPVPSAAAETPPVYTVGNNWVYNCSYNSGTGVTDTGVMSTSVTDTNGPNYALTVIGSGTVTKTPDMVKYPGGTRVTLTCVPAAGYIFDSWTRDASGTTNPVAVTMDSPKLVQFNCISDARGPYNLTLHNTNGSITKSPDLAQYPRGMTVTLTAVPNTGYRFDHWSGSASGTTNPVAVTMNGAKTVTANFVSGTGGPYTLTVNATNGSVTRAPDQANYTSGTTVTLTAVPDAGYHFTGWSGDASGTTSPVDITMGRDKTVFASFAINTYTQLADYVPDAIRVDATTGFPLTVNSADVDIIKANMQFHVQYANILAYGTLADNATVLWTYADPVPGWPPSVGDTWNFTKHTWDDRGIVNKTVTRQGKVLAVEDVTVNIPPNPPVTYSNCLRIVEYDPAHPGVYTYEHWFNENTIGSDVKMIDRETYKGQETRELTSTNYVPPGYTLTVNATHGSVTRDPDLAQYPHGTEVELTASADPGYHFTGWSGDASGTDNPVDITMDGNKTVTANFAINTYTLTVNATNGSVTRDPDLTDYPHGTEVTLTAVPDPGYHFTGWSGDASGTDNPVDITMDGNKTVTASFAINTYTLTVNATHGSVTRDPDMTDYPHGTEVELTASADPGYHFTSWSGDASGTDNPVDITMDGNKTVTASFAITVINPTVSSITPSILGNGKGNQSAPITIYGTDFVPGSKTKVMMIQSGVLKPKKKAAKYVVVSDDKTITCNLVLTSAAAGAWDIVVTNPNKRTGTLTGGLTVTQHPTITLKTGVNPPSGKTETAILPVTITGTDFVSSAVKLTKKGLPDINATSVVVSSTTITCNFDLTGAAVGTWTGVVRNPDNGIGTFKFKVTL